MIKVNVTGGELSREEIDAYIARANEKYPDGQVNQMDIHIDGEFVDISYRFCEVPFDRIRRITGYLVGTLDRFNNAKYAEVNDRVKHTVA